MGEVGGRVEGVFRKVEDEGGGVSRAGVYDAGWEEKGEGGMPRHVRRARAAVSVAVAAGSESGSGLGAEGGGGSGGGRGGRVRGRTWGAGRAGREG